MDIERFEPRGTCAATFLARDREAALARAARDGDERALAVLLAAHEPLVAAAASRFLRDGVQRTDLVAEGRLALLEAARSFDPTRGARFAAYAGIHVRARVRHFAYANRRIVAMPSTRNARRLQGCLHAVVHTLEGEAGGTATRSAIAAATGTTEDDVALVQAALGARDVPADGVGTGDLPSPGPSPEDVVGAHETSARVSREVARALATLEPRERDLVRRRILRDDGAPLAALGAAYGLSLEGVRRLEATAKQKLRDALLAGALADDVGATVGAA